MKRLLLPLILVFLFVQTLPNGEAFEQNLKEGQIIRRAFLDVKGVPPTPTELAWYLTYNREGYEKAISYLLSENINPKLKELLKTFLLSPEYKNKNQSVLTKEEQIFIIQYQIGNLFASPEEADKKLISISISSKENGYEPLDYMAELLMARSTSASEETLLGKIIKNTHQKKMGIMRLFKL